MHVRITCMLLLLVLLLPPHSFYYQRVAYACVCVYVCMHAILPKIAFNAYTCTHTHTQSHACKPYNLIYESRCSRASFACTSCNTCFCHYIFCSTLHKTNTSVYKQAGTQTYMQSLSLESPSKMLNAYSTHEPELHYIIFCVQHTLEQGMHMCVMLKHSIAQI